MSVKININQTIKINISNWKPVIKETAKKILEEEGYDDKEISITLVSEDEIKKLNQEYLGILSPTDVISFALNESFDPEPAKKLLGDIYICYDIAVLQAEEAGTDIIDELNLLTIHGVLHLIGYDDKDAIQKRKMDERTNYYLNKLQM